MATLADELLNDFDDSGPEDDEQIQNGLVEDDSHNKKEDAHRHGDDKLTPGMELDGDEEGVSDAEKELMKQNNAADHGDTPDEEETKARVEKMKLGGVSDVRSVAGLMKTLQPVLEVRILLFLLRPFSPRVRDIRVYIFIAQPA
jgi:U4/U6 small nuclear ribonucleoprotein PRP31